MLTVFIPDGIHGVSQLYDPLFTNIGNQLQLPDFFFIPATIVNLASGQVSIRVDIDLIDSVNLILNRIFHGHNIFFNRFYHIPNGIESCIAP